MKRSTVPLMVCAVLVCLAGVTLWGQGGCGAGAGCGAGGTTSRDDMRRYERMGMDAQGESSIAYKRPAEVLLKNPKLASKLQSLLPGETNLLDVASGFKNLGEFVTAIHAATNLGIPFEQLKSKLVGTGKTSLSKAIRELRPDVNPKSEEKKARKQADTVIRENETVARPSAP